MLGIHNSCCRPAAVACLLGLPFATNGFAQGDDCSDPLTAMVGTNLFDSTGFTTSEFESGGTPCENATPGAPEEDVFFTWTVPASGNWQLDTYGTGLDTVIQIHLGDDCSATCVAQGDGGADGIEETELKLCGLTAGTEYLIQVGTFLPMGGGISSFEITQLGAVPSNDTCATPVTLPPLGSILWNNSTACTSGLVAGAPCQPVAEEDSPKSDLFFRWGPNNDGDYRFDTRGSDLDTVLNIYDGINCGAPCIAFDDDSGENGESAIVLQDLAQGDVYLIQVGTWHDSGSGDGVLTTTYLGSVTANDDCASPRILGPTLGTTPFTNSFATTTAFNGGGLPCPVIGQNGEPRNDLFFSWVSPVAGNYRVDTRGSGFDTVMSIHSGDDCSATCFAHDDDGSGDGESRIHLVGIGGGTPFLLQVGGWGPSVGLFGELNISLLAAPPTNDMCSNAIPILGETVVAWDNQHPLLSDSGFDGGDASTCFSAANSPNTAIDTIRSDLFYQWTPECFGDYVISTEASSPVFDTKLNVHLGTGCSATCLDANDDADTFGGNLLSRIDLVGATVNDTYLIQLGTWSDDTLRDTGVLSIERLGPECGAGVITVECDPAAQHTGGTTAKIDSSYFGGPVGTGLHLDAIDGPVNQFAFFLVSGTRSVTLPVFDGILCLGGSQGRYSNNIATNQGLPQLDSICKFDLAGVLVNVGGNSTTGLGFDVPFELPFTPPGQLITLGVGETWYFQLWFRDGLSANFSNVVKAVFP